MSALRTHYVEISQHADNADGSLSVTAIARRSGIMRYRSDSGDRLEFVPPELIDARDDQGRPVMGMLAGAPNTNEHPAQVIRYSTDSRKAVQVGKVNEEIHIFNDAEGERSVKVRFDVEDPETIADIRSGRKKGVSLGYLCNVIKEDGEYKGQPYTHKQAMPFTIDHLAIVANPRNPGALITRFDSDDVAVISMDAARSPIEVIRVDGCCAACSESEEEEEQKTKKKKVKTDAEEMPMIPIIFAGSIQDVTVEQAQSLWTDGTIDRVRLDGADYFMAADMALTLAHQGILHEDAFVKMAGVKKGGGLCGRGWVGVKGSCKQIAKGADRAGAQKSALKDFAQGQRAGKYKGGSPQQQASKVKQATELSQAIKEKASKSTKRTEPTKSKAANLRNMISEKESSMDVKGERLFKSQQGKGNYEQRLNQAATRERVLKHSRELKAGKEEGYYDGYGPEPGKSFKEKVAASAARNASKKAKMAKAEPGSSSNSSIVTATKSEGSKKRSLSGSGRARREKRSQRSQKVTADSTESERFDAFLKRLKITQTGGRCGRGWIGVKGRCRRELLAKEEQKSAENLNRKKAAKTDETIKKRGSKETSEALAEKKESSGLDRANDQHDRIVSKLSPKEKLAAHLEYTSASSTIGAIAKYTGVSEANTKKWIDTNLASGSLRESSYKNAFTGKQITQYAFGMNKEGDKLSSQIKKRYKEIKDEDNIEQAPLRAKERMKLQAIKASQGRIREEKKQVKK